MSTYVVVGWSASADRPLCCGQVMDLVGAAGPDRQFACAAQPRLDGCRQTLTTSWRTPSAPGGRIGDVAIVSHDTSRAA